jgi:uncharacterized protein
LTVSPDPIPPEQELVAVQVWRICPWPDGAPIDSFLVCLQSADLRILPITIGEFEGKALYMAHEGIEPERPLPYNLLEDCISRVGGQVERLVIHTLEDKVFHACLEVVSPQDRFRLDCRPSDGMVLATLLRVPILVSEEVLAVAGRRLSDDEDALCKEGQDQERPHEHPAAKQPSQQEPVSHNVVSSDLERLQDELASLVAVEDYEEAARVRDRIMLLKKDGRV